MVFSTLSGSNRAQAFDTDGPLMVCGLRSGTVVYEDNPISHGEKMQSSEQNLDISLGRQIRLRRVKKGMSVQQLADAVGVTAQEFSDYEAGRTRPAPSQLFDIATALDVTISYLFSGLPGSHEPTDTTDGS